MSVLRNSRKNEYGQLFSEIAAIIHQGRSRVVQAIDVIQAKTYWSIGKVIVKYEQQGKVRAEYGDKLIERLSIDMVRRFGKGFSQTNLRMMRLFYQSFPIRQTVSDEFSPKLSWSHYCELLKEDDIKSRSFYEIEAIANSWSMRELRRQMDALLYERLALSRDKKKVKALASKGQVIDRPEDAICGLFQVCSREH